MIRKNSLQTKTNIRHSTAGSGTRRDEMTTEATRGLLSCGVLAGPLFIGVSLIQALSRQGFDLTRHPLSMLSLGDLCWIQITNFVLSGLLVIAYAVGMWRPLHPGRGGNWGPGPWLVGTSGLCLILVGVFPTEPGLGFPPGAPEGILPVMSLHARVHNMALFVAISSLAVACFVFGRRFASVRQWGWAAYCVATGVAAIALPVLLGIAEAAYTGFPVLGVAVVTSAWISIVGVRLLAERNLEDTDSVNKDRKEQQHVRLKKNLRSFNRRRVSP